MAETTAGGAAKAKKHTTKKIAKKAAKKGAKKAAKKQPAKKKAAAKKPGIAPKKGTKPTTFGRVLNLFLDKREKKLADMARTCKTDGPYLSMIRYGRCRPPLHQIPKWAKAMKFTKEEQAIFVLAAELEHTPDRIRKLFLDADIPQAKKLKEVLKNA